MRPPAALGLRLRALAATSRRQAATWKDSRTLFTHALAATGGNWLAHQNLGAFLVDHGEPGAIDALRQAIALGPWDADYHGNLGVAYSSLGRVAEAAAEYRRALAIDPALQAVRVKLRIAEAKLRGGGRRRPTCPRGLGTTPALA